ncbi:MAG: DNA polymerase III subunit beta [Bacteroidetes bacterium]|nr:DNA polymerase III subunit beta [Bacteroidota bacterium]
MKFIVKKNEIEKAFSQSITLVPTRSIVQELNNALFKLEKGKLTIYTTDLKITLITVINIESNDKGEIAVPIETIYQTIKSISATDIQFSIDDETKKIKIKAGKGNYSISGINTENFPEIPKAVSENEVEFNTDQLRKIFKTVKFAINSEEKRISMSGAYLNFKNDKIIFVTTDGHRLVRYTIKNEKKNESQEIIIPLNTLSVVEKLITGEKTKISTNGKQISFYFDNSVITSSLIEEKYPNYEAVIPLENNLTLRVDKQEFISSIKRVSLYSSSTNYQIRLFLKNNEIQVSAKDVDFGKEAQEEVQCEYSGDEFEIGFNSQYLIEVASHIPGDDIIFKLQTQSRAVILEPDTEKNTNENLLMLIMPLRLNA